MSEDSGPPIRSPTTQKLSGTYPQYADTPMPYDDDSQDDDSQDDPTQCDEQQETGGVFYNAVTILAIAIAVAHLWTVWTLRADINIVLAYQKEHAQQYSHIIALLQNMKQVQWQIVPA